MSDEKERDRKFALFKMEYEQAAQRYENIYKAIWQNFSYLAAISGGILAFGADELPLPLVGLLALSPLVLWFLATYIPMDRYGQLTRARLGVIETILNGEFLRGGEGKTATYEDKRLGSITVPVQLGHYRRFYGSAKGYRVKTALVSFGCLVLAAFICFAVATVAHYGREPASMSTETVAFEARPVEIQVSSPEIQGVQSALEALTEQVQALERRIQEPTPDTAE